MKNKFVVHIVEAAWVEEAMASAVQRRNFHSGFGSKRHWHDASKGEYTDEYYGSLAHIVFREALRNLGIVGEFAPLYTENLSELPEWDAFVCGKSIEIKAVPPDTDKIRKRLLVKVAEFKGQDIYLVVKFWNEIEYSFCGYLTGDSVRNLPVHNFGFAPAYWKFIDQLDELDWKIFGEGTIS